MTELYYTDPLAAAYMMREFGVNYYIIHEEHGKLIVTDIELASPDFESKTLKSQNKKGVTYCFDDCGYDLYVETDNHHIFEPKSCDTVLSNGGFQYLFDKNSSAEDGERILLRGNNRFFMPEVA